MARLLVLRRSSAISCLNNSIRQCSTEHNSSSLKKSPVQRRLLDQPMFMPSVSSSLNPITWIKRTIALNTAKELDKDGDYEIRSLQIGAAKAMIAIAELIRARDFEALQEIVSDNLLDKIKETVDYVTDSALDQLLLLKESDIVVTLIKDAHLQESSDGNKLLHIFAVAIARKNWKGVNLPEYWPKNDALNLNRLTINMQLSKRLSPPPPDSDFCISQLNYFHPLESVILENPQEKEE